MPRLRHAVGISFLLAALVLAAPATASAYVNPFAGDTPLVGRTDMGIDACLSPGDPIRAIGDGTVVGIIRDWYAGQPYLWYQLSGGPQAGAYVYVAEQIDHLARVGQTVQAGDVIARYARRGSCIEIGWSMADGTTQAQASSGYRDGQVTKSGVSFARFLLSLGVSGQFQLSAPQSQTDRVTTTRRHRRHRSPPVTAPTSVPAPTPKPHPLVTPKPHPRPEPVTRPAPVSPSAPVGAHPGPDFNPGSAPYWPAQH